MLHFASLLFCTAYEMAARSYAASAILNMGLAQISVEHTLQRSLRLQRWEVTSTLPDHDIVA
jgi:hypothetical protein